MAATVLAKRSPSVLHGRNHHVIIYAVTSPSSSSFSTSSTVGKSSVDAMDLKRGTGYRSSFSGIVATVFGASGCVSRFVCNRLGKIGSQIVIPYHRDHSEFLHLKMAGDLGQVLFTPYYLKDEESIRKAIKYSNVVINLVGRDWETRNFSFKDVNVTGPQTLARLSREAGVEKFIHMSSVNARENPERVFLPKGSAWLKTKWEGEQAVMSEFPDATIFRASDIYSQRSAYIRRMINTRILLKHLNIQLWKKGDQTFKQPVFGPDLASGIMAAIESDDSKGKIYEAIGPEIFRHSELLRWISVLCNRTYDNTTCSNIKLSTWGWATFGSLWKLAPRYFREHNLDVLERSNLSDVSMNYPNLRDLGVQLHSASKAMPHVLSSLRSELTNSEYSFAPPTLPEPPVLGNIEVKHLVEKNKSAFLF